MVTAGGAVAEGFENARDRGDSAQRLLCGERTESDVIVHKRRFRLANHLLIRLHIGDALAIAVPQSVEQLGAEFLARGRCRNCLVGTGNWRIGHGNCSRRENAPNTKEIIGFLSRAAEGEFAKSTPAMRHCGGVTPLPLSASPTRCNPPACSCRRRSPFRRQYRARAAA